MSSGRLQQQFIRLWQCCDGKSQETTLNELAEMLSCSRRHMRTLLNMMEARGWLTSGGGGRTRQAFPARFSLYRSRAATAEGGRSAGAGQNRSAGTAGGR